MRRSEEHRHKSGKKFPFYGTVGFTICFSIDPRKLRSKIRKTYLSTAFWSWHSWKLKKMKVFVFLNFLEILFLKKYPFVVQWASWHVSLSISKNRTQKYAILTSPQHFEVDILGNFQKWKFSSLSKFFSLTYARVPQIASHILVLTKKLIKYCTQNVQHLMMNIFELVGTERCN